jgi:hypothetical protein
MAAGIALMFAFTACENQVADIYDPEEAQLLSLRIGVGNIDVVLSESKIPAPTDNTLWNDEDNFDLYGMESLPMSLKAEDFFDNSVRFFPSVSKGAKVKWGAASRTVRPNDYYDTRVPAIFSEGEFIYFMVTSENDKTTNYYRFATYLSSPVKELSAITLAGREGDMNTVSPDTEWNGPRVTPGLLYITQSEAASATVDAVAKDARSTLRYAKTSSATTAPSFGDSNVINNIGDGEFLWIEVVAENEEDKYVYCFRIYTGRIATIKKLTFKTDSEEYEATGKGTAKNIWSDNTGAGSFESPHQPAAGFSFAVELEETNGRWQYAKASSIPSSAPAWVSPDSNSETPTFLFSHNDYLLIKVIPPNRAAGDARADYYYKVRVGLLAADFKVQPKSHAYKANEAAVALEFELDRELPAGATYRWYEANSWYGGYGFDSMGRIGGKGEIIADAQFGNDDKGTIDGIAYDVSGWHVKDLDEKNNVSLHNGGNQYYRLPTPGKPIPGATGPTYTPTTNRRPFLGSSTVETHYYWVEITAGNLKAVSKRAVILTEWGTKYNLGKPTSEEVEKDHYIIDLYAYQTEGAYGLKAPPRNAAPFKAGNHGDSYWIPVTFPDTFNIMDYSDFTAQALFFLADGRPWIQNWTQGDIGFGRTKEGGTKGNPDDGEEIVLWYNLTSDMASRGLASSGNAGLSGAGSGLAETPEYIVVKPAGTKKITLMPPFNADGTPQNTGDAQGWFTPYIELCEVRFEGPPRGDDEAEAPCECEGDAEECTCPEDECECDECE